MLFSTAFLHQQITKYGKLRRHPTPEDVRKSKNSALESNVLDGLACIRIRFVSDGSIRLIIIAPTWLQPSLAVLLEVDTDILLLATFKSIGAYLSFDVPADIVLLYASKNNHLVSEQVKRVLSVSEQIRCIAVINDPRHTDMVIANGASEVLLFGVSPTTILETVKNVSRSP